jgi:hypothetical protein
LTTHAELTTDAELTGDELTAEESTKKDPERNHSPS